MRPLPLLTDPQPVLPPYAPQRSACSCTRARPRWYASPRRTRSHTSTRPSTWTTNRRSARSKKYSDPSTTSTSPSSSTAAYRPHRSPQTPSSTSRPTSCCRPRDSRSRRRPLRGGEGVGVGGAGRGVEGVVGLVVVGVVLVVEEVVVGSVGVEVGSARGVVVIGEVGGVGLGVAVRVDEVVGVVASLGHPHKLCRCCCAGEIMKSIHATVQTNVAGGAVHQRCFVLEHQSQLAAKPAFAALLRCPAQC